jgi:hypothetical protein
MTETGCEEWRQRIMPEWPGTAKFNLRGAQQ